MAELVIERERNYYYPHMYLYRVIDVLIALVEGMLGLRLLLAFFGANPASSFVAWVYSVTGGLVAPFVGAFPSWSFGNFFIDTPTILAMIAYSILGWLLVRLVSFVLDSARSLP